jgi:hypothetical protein
MRGPSSQLDWVQIPFTVPMEVPENALERIESAFDVGKPRRLSGNIL